ANTVLFRIVDNKGDTLARSTVIIKTGILPTYFPMGIVAQKFDESKVEPGLTLVSSLHTSGLPVPRPTMPYFVDDYGDPRWVLDYCTNPDLDTMNYGDGIA